MTMHKYKVGQLVGYVAGGRLSGPRGEYRVIARLPGDSRGLQYRIKNKAEPHERIALEQELMSKGTLSG